ncbi:MAG: Gmad2 immunoglobulin-like domain-containing protein [Patescibacteria group bacterium]
MKKRYILLIFVFLFAAAAWGFVDSLKTKAPAQDTIPEEQVSAPVQKDDLIVIDMPRTGQAIGSPLTITGKARGNWFFEASAPVELVTDAGTIIARGIIQAQGDWMTADYVPFSGTLTYSVPPAGTVGTLILRKDNPSGEARFDNSVAIKVQW